jgi:hypothetical protein
MALPSLRIMWQKGMQFFKDPVSIDMPFIDDDVTMWHAF